MKHIYLIITFFLSILSLSLSAQQGTLKGNITSSDGPVVNASVFVENTTIGTITDLDGNYSFKLDAGTYPIKVQMLGYKTEETTIVIEKGATKTYSIKMREDALGLEQVVVSADRNQMTRVEAPVVINTVGEKIFVTTQAVTIADGLDFSPGLRMESNCSNCGFSQLRMNGLDGPYSQILINSRPVFSGLAGVYGLDLIPASMVERLEIVRGGGSALFGGNAIAGTVNIITKEPTMNSLSVGTDLMVSGLSSHYEGEPVLDHVINVNGAVVSEDNNTGLFFYGISRDKDPYDENGDGYSEEVYLQNKTFGFSAYHKPNKKNKLTLDFYNINEYRRGGNMFDYLPHEADIAELVDHDILGTSLALDHYADFMKISKISVFGAMQKVNRDSYYGAEQDPNAYGNTNDLTANAGVQVSKRFDKLLVSPSSLIVGFDNNYNKLVDTKLGANGDPNTIIADQYVNTSGAYFQNTWKLPVAKISVGARFDSYVISNVDDSHDDIQGNVIIPRANMLYNINKNLQYRLSYAKGYRAPQIFDEDLHIETSGARKITHSNAEDLTQENSHTLTTSFRYAPWIRSIQTEFMVEGFYTIIENRFANEYTEVEEGHINYVRTNAEDGALVAGVNLETNIAFSPKLSTQLSTTIQKNEFETAQDWGDTETYPDHTSKLFMRTPNVYGYLTFSWEAFKNFHASATATYTGRMYVPHFGLDPDTDVPAEMEAIANGDVIAGERLEKSESFLILGINLKYSMPLKGKTKLDLKLGLDNLLNQEQAQHDKGLYRDAGYIYGPCEPRSIKFGLALSNLLN